MSGVVTNFYEIGLPFESFNIRCIQYTPEKLKELRLNHNQTHSFFRRDVFLFTNKKELSSKLSLLVI